MDAEKPPELDDGIRMVVDAQIDRDIAAAAISRTDTADEDGGALPTARVATGAIPGKQGCVEAIGERLLRVARDEGRLHRGDHLGAGEDVSLNCVAGPRDTPGPGHAVTSREGGGASLAVDDAGLALVAAVIRGGKGA